MSDDILKQLAETANNPAAVGAAAVRAAFAAHFGTLPVESQCAIMAVLSGDFLLSNICGLTEKKFAEKGITAGSVSGVVYSSVVLKVTTQMAKETACMAIDKALADGRLAAGKRT